ncbi:MAG: glucosamine-6-phosphate deaminase [Candidatus Hodarchaeales archaeon]|jgi:glucosamine-6-phosphate deaminase
MDVTIRLMNNQTFTLSKFDFLEFDEKRKKEIDLTKLAIKIFNIVNTYGPKAIVLECENKALQSYLIDSLSFCLQDEFTFEKLGGGVQILTSLPFYSEEPISLTSKIKKLGQFENQIGLGVEVGGKTINGVCIDGNGNIIKRLERSMKKGEDYKSVINLIIDLIKELLESLNPEKIKSVGIGIPGGIGPIFVRRMIIMGDFHNINLRAEIENAIGHPTFIENDANVIALGEKEISRIEGDFFTLTLGESVGGGIIINDRIIHGENYFAGELGHIIIDDTIDAPVCGCGNKGCLEAKISKISNFTKENLDEIAKDLARAIRIIVNLTGINQVLIGSNITKFGYNFYETIRDNLKTRFIPKITPVQVYESSLEKFPETERKFVGTIGAAIMGMQKVGEISEKVVVVVKKDDNEMGIATAQIIAEQIRRKPNTVLGLATGSTPISMYKELVRMHKEENLNFSQITTFNLDEYFPLKRENSQSYQTFMLYWLFDHVNVNPENIHIPNGEISEENLDSYCEHYEQLIQKVGGIDIQILGIGESFFTDKGEIHGGHIGFNESGSEFSSRTRKVVLAEKTRVDNARFFQRIEEVPRYAISMGIGTILEAKRIILLASGEHKALIIKQAVEDKITTSIPASVLQAHANTTFLIEEGAASNLSRMSYPWLFFDMNWMSTTDKTRIDEAKIDEALIWLSLATKKPLDQLDLQDFHNNFLSDLLQLFNYNVPSLTNEVIERITSKIIFKEKLPRHKKVLVISCRPGDDGVIADIIRSLVSNHNRVKIINMVSGNINVKNSDVVDYCEQNLIEKSIKEHILNNTIDMIELLQLKTLVRKSETIDMHAYMGVSSENQIFLNLPFYETRTIEKIVEISDDDFIPLISILDEEQPDIIFILGGITDPHGLKARIVEIFELALKKATIQKVELWYYKTIMEEFSVAKGDIIIPFSEKEMDLKAIAIQRLKSQQVVDFLIIPGFDPRPLWERIKERNQSVGHILRTTGLVPDEYNYASICQTSQYIKDVSKK